MSDKVDMALVLVGIVVAMAATGAQDLVAIALGGAAGIGLMAVGAVRIRRRNE